MKTGKLLQTTMSTCLTVLFLGLIACSESVDSPEKPPIIERKDINLNEADTNIARQNHSFALSLLRNIYNEKTEDANIFISPLSASIALMMVDNGANGETHKEIQSVLGFEDFSREEQNSFAQKLIKSMSELDNRTTFECANSIWIKKYFPVLQTFIDVNKNFYDAEIRNEPFDDPATLGLINKWAEDKTHGKIKDLISAISPDHVMFLINALYFKGIWTQEFDKNLTKDEKFYNADGSTSLVPTMTNTAGFVYSSLEQCTLLEMPFGNEAFGMLMLLPEEGGSLDEIVGRLDGEMWEQYLKSLANMTPRNVTVKVPRFKLEYDISLNKVLQTMGMRAAFSAEADFSLINPGRLLQVSNVKQKAFVEINEEGGEAAAATVVEICESAGINSEPPEFRVDRPFMFFIKEKSTGTIFFAGVVRKM